MGKIRASKLNLDDGKSNGKEISSPLKESCKKGIRNNSQYRTSYSRRAKKKGTDPQTLSIESRLVLVERNLSSYEQGKGEV